MRAGLCGWNGMRSGKDHIADCEQEQIICATATDLLNAPIGLPLF